MKCKCIHCKKEFDQSKGKFIAVKITQDVTFDKMPHFFICNECFKKVNDQPSYSMGCKLEKPKVLADLGNGLERLISQCQGYIEEIDTGGRVDEDTEHYIFEAAMECFFGKDVWKWINSKSR